MHLSWEGGYRGLDSFVTNKPNITDMKCRMCINLKSPVNNVTRVELFPLCPHNKSRYTYSVIYKYNTTPSPPPSPNHLLPYFPTSLPPSPPPSPPLLIPPLNPRQLLIPPLLLISISLLQLPLTPPSLLRRFLPRILPRTLRRFLRTLCQTAGRGLDIFRQPT